MTKIILTGGGTAGHVHPLLAVAKILQRNHAVKLVYVGSSGIEKETVLKENIPFRTILTGKRRNYASLHNFLDIFKVFLGTWQAFFILRSFRPDVILAKGGYVTFPVLFWAKSMKIPVIIHESDSVMGRTNRWAASFARRVCVGFPMKYYRDIPVEKTVYTGVPTSKDFFSGETNAAKPAILVTGGSQGSQAINKIVFQIALELVKQFEVYHIVGKKNYELIADKKNEMIAYHVIAYTDEMSKLMAQSDLIISRASASTLSEISALSKCAILIPLPGAAQDHQTANAKVYEENTAAVVLSEKNLTAGSLLSIIKHLMADDKMREILGRHAHEFSVPDSAQEIVDIIFEVINEKH